MNYTTTPKMNSTIDVEIIRNMARKDLMALIQKCPGDKALVWDRALANPVNLIASSSDFKEQGVVKMLSLDQGVLPPPSEVPETILFICRPLVSLMPLISSCIRNDEKQRRRRKFHIFFLPRTSKLCEKWLEDNGVTPSIASIEELPMLLFPLDKDVLTMELDNCFEEFHIENDPTSLHHVAKALVFLQKKFGVPTKLFGKGLAARYVYSLMKGLKSETSFTKSQVNNIEMDHMILIDRQIDLLSPLVTQLTYEGLIDEFYGINNNHVKFPEEKFNESKTMNLTSNDELYAELRDKNFSAVGGTLRAKTTEIQEIFKQKDKAQSMGEMKRLVQQLPYVNALKQSLSNHTSIAELLKSKTESDEFLASLECEQELLNGMDTDKINSHIEDLCHRQAPLTKILRLLIVQCITSGGLKPKVIQHYERLIIQNFGFQHILTLQRLYSVGLLKIQGGSKYSVLRRTLNLTVCDGSEVKPDDFAYVHSIYAPITIRLVQHRLKPGLWSMLRDSISLIPGPTIDEENDDFSSNSSISVGRRPSKFTVVVFIGGCTYAEISALRFLAQQDDEREFIVLTTKIINGNTFLDGLFKTIPIPEA